MLLNTYLFKVLYKLWIFKKVPPNRTEINTLTFGKSYIHKLSETIMSVITQQLDVYNNNRIRVKILEFQYRYPLITQSREVSPPPVQTGGDSVLYNNNCRISPNRCIIFPYKCRISQ